MPNGSSAPAPSPTPPPPAATVEEPMEDATTDSGVTEALAEATLSVLNNLLALL